ncbi:MAG: hypothetical protein J0I06_27580 [Planctomycetes bacterium]|nr:hypothetical protein [Planctomycetota bacterium]
MPIFVNMRFRFSQYFVQGDGGWCGGISHALITHLYENLDNNLTYISPLKAATQAQDYVSLLNGTYSRITGRAASWAGPIRNPIRQLQTPFNFGGGGHTQGGYEYAFDTPGTAFLRLIVREPPDNNYGSDFQSWYSMGGGSNHAGVAVWTPAGEVFLFDPNCGGLLLNWQPCPIAASFPVVVDRALEDMYTRYDRLRGGRSAKIVSAQRLDPASLPYGQV